MMVTSFGNKMTHNKYHNKKKSLTITVGKAWRLNTWKRGLNRRERCYTALKRWNLTLWNRRCGMLDSGERGARGPGAWATTICWAIRTNWGISHLHGNDRAVAVDSWDSWRWSDSYARWCHVHVVVGGWWDIWFWLTTLGILIEIK